MSLSVIHPVPLGLAEAKRVELASRMLSQIPVGGRPEDIFDVLASCVPVVGGLLSTFGVDPTGQIITRSVHVPSTLLDGWWMGLRYDSEQSLQSLIELEQGANFSLFRSNFEVVSAASNIGAIDALEEFEVVQSLAEHGLSSDSGHKVLTPTPSLRVEPNIAMALVTERGLRLSRTHHSMLTALGPSIRASVLRSGLPLAHSMPLLAQIVEEQQFGYIVLSSKGQVLEVNRRGAELVRRYATTVGLVGTRYILQDFVDRILGSFGAGLLSTSLRSPGGDSVLQVHWYRLAKEVHAIPEDIILLHMMEATTRARALRTEVLLGLPQRLREIAILLATTQHSHKELAAGIGISENEFRKCVVRIYRLLGVPSRAELASRLAQSHPNDVTVGPKAEIDVGGGVARMLRSGASGDVNGPEVLQQEQGATSEMSKALESTLAAIGDMLDQGRLVVAGIGNASSCVAGEIGQQIDLMAVAAVVDATLVAMRELNVGLDELRERVGRFLSVVDEESPEVG